MDFLTLISAVTNVVLAVLLSISLFRLYGKSTNAVSRKNDRSAVISSEDHTAWIDLAKVGERMRLPSTINFALTEDTRCDSVSATVCFNPQSHTRIRAMMRYSRARCITDVISDALLRHEWLLGLDTKDYEFGYHDQQKWVVVPLQIKYNS